MAEGKICGLAHFGLFITDIEVTKKFYKDILEFNSVFEYTMNDGTKVAFLKNGDCMIEAVQFPNPEKRKDGWFDHLAMRVENIEAVKENLEKKGIQFEDQGNITHCPECFPGGSKWILFRGPDGEHLELNEVL